MGLLIVTARAISYTDMVPCDGDSVGMTLGRAGMRWTKDGANAIIALRCCKLSGRYEYFWEYRSANS